MNTLVGPIGPTAAETWAAAGRSPLARPLRVLLLEDCCSDADLILGELRHFGFDVDCVRVETEADFVARLEPSLDVILADYSLPSFDGLSALRCLQQTPFNIPFIIITGSLGDEVAARCIKEGVSDYLLKDRLERLGLAVSHLLDQRRLQAERAEFEAHLRQAQKLESVGQLAGGIAHDFNNMLTVIKGFVGIVLDTNELSADSRDALLQVYAAGERAESLTRQLLIFSRKQPVDLRPVSLNEIIVQLASMLRRLIGEQFELTLDLADSLPAIRADPGMIEQVLMNLTVNARDAMEQGGEVLIRTARCEITPAAAAGRANARPGTFARLSVQDTGCGIAPEIVARIFEPFFTTKAPGKGTGLGLATVFGIVQQHRGWVDVVSTVAVGTTVVVYWPIAADALANRFADLPASKAAGGTETILVVEDESSVRNFAAAVLRPYGYRVLQARSGAEALALWRQSEGRIDLVLTDVVMPDGMSGPQLAAKLQAQRPALAVIYTTGYSPEHCDRHLPASSRARLLRKPYLPRALAAAIRESLDARRR